MIRPYYQRGLVTLYHGRAEDVAPHLHRRGLILCDPPYSATVHAHAVSAGRRHTPLLDGNGRASPCTLARKVDLEFEPITPELRRFLAEQAARLASRWALFFCDAEGLGEWKRDLNSAGITYRTHCVWRKIGGTPKFAGNEAAIPDETIALAGDDVEEALAGGYVACAHRPPDTVTPARFWHAGGKLGYYEVNTVLNRGDRIWEQRINATQKPEKLIEQMILDWAEPAEPLIDFTAGGGTTLVVGARLGHPVIGIEQRIGQCEQVAARLERLYSRPDLIEAATRERIARWAAAKRARAAAAAGRKAVRDAAERQTSIFDLAGLAA